MYEAKRAGRDRYHVATSTTTTASARPPTAPYAL